MVVSFRPSLKVDIGRLVVQGEGTSQELGSLFTK